MQSNLERMAGSILVTSFTVRMNPAICRISFNHPTQRCLGRFRQIVRLIDYANLDAGRKGVAACETINKVPDIIDTGLVRSIDM